MKVLSIVAAGVLAVATLPPAHADELLPAKQSATLLGSTAAGVALGGPVGMLAGAVIGVIFSENLETAATAESTHVQLVQAQDALAASYAELDQSQREMLALQRELDAARETSMQYASLMLQQLELEMLFRTGDPQLSETGQRRLRLLATFLKDNPDINVRLDGHADPRGDASYNRQLSLARVSTVARELEDLGIAAARIETHSHGASQSNASEGDYDAYALERVVRINLSPASGLAQSN